MWPGGISNDIIVGFVGVNDIPLVHIFQKDLQTCLTGKNRQDHAHISLAKENSASFGPPERKEAAMMTRGLRASESPAHTRCVTGAVRFQRLRPPASTRLRVVYLSCSSGAS
jgi:hypothetical protein